jgi:hypothetical protein
MPPIGSKRLTQKMADTYNVLECLELVTEIAQPLQSIIDNEKSHLPSHRIISDPSVTMESERRRIGEVLRSIQLPCAPETILKRRGLERQPSTFPRSFRSEPDNTALVGFEAGCGG